jgi:hypothetical protein
VAGRAATIRRVVRDGFMPPWFAAPGSGPWANDPSLSVWERRTLFRWLDSGMPPGDPADSPLPRRFETGWTIGTPDLVLELPEPQQVPAEGFLEYRHVALDLAFPEDRWVQAMQILPSARVNVHHVLVFAEPRGRGTVEALRDRLLALAARPGVLRSLESYFVAYGPGTASTVFPPGIAKRLPAKVRLLFQIHYVTTGIPAVDQTRLGIVFAKDPPRHELRTSSAFNRDFAIPPGASNHEVSGAYEFQDHGQVLSFGPHMHLRGKAFRYELVSPEGARTLCSRSPLRLQLADRVRAGEAGPRGSGLARRHRLVRQQRLQPCEPGPDLTVAWIQSTDEMMIGYFNWIPDTPARSARAAP